MGQSCSGQRPNKAAAHRQPKAKAKAKAGGHHHRHHHAHRNAHPSASSRHVPPLAPAHPAYAVVDISEPFGLPHQPAQYQPAQHHHHHRPLPPPPPHHHSSSRRHRSGSSRQAPVQSAQSASPPPPPVPPKRTHTRSSRHHRPAASTPYSHAAYQQAPRIKETVLHYHGGHNYNFHDGEVSPLSPGDDVGPYSNRPVSPLTPPQTSHGSSATAGYPSYPGSEPYARASKTWRSY